MCVVCFTSSRASRPGVSHNRLNMSIAMHSACSKHWIKVVSKNAQLLLLNQVEDRLKTLKIQHRFFFLTDNNSTFVFEGIQSCAKNVISH